MLILVAHLSPLLAKATTINPTAIKETVKEFLIRLSKIKEVSIKVIKEPVVREQIKGEFSKVGIRVVAIREALLI